MKIAIKYCGGCNPKFDRKELVQQMRNKYTKHTFKFIDKCDEYDIIWIIAGCPSQCMDITEYEEYKYLITTEFISNINFEDHTVN